MINYIIVEQSTSKIISCGVCHCPKTYTAQQVPNGCTKHEFTGGIIGQYYYNNAMHESPPTG